MKKILIVDDEPNNLQLLRQILKNDYQLIFASNGEKALQATNKHLPNLILLDIMMPDMSGYEVCIKLKESINTKDIPVIFVTAMNDIEDEVHGFDVGAVDYIQKPVSAPIVKKRVETHLSLVHITELEQSQKEAIFMLGEAGHYNDTDTGEHIWRMAAYAKELAKLMGWSEEMSKNIELAAPMHDTGKIGIPDSILKAPRKLTSDEWKIMKEHTIIGHKILSNSNTAIFKLASEIAQNHHEKWNGSGYPMGLKGEEIPESARIVAIADVFDALTMKRPYKQAWSSEDSLAEIKKGSGTHFQPELVKHFEDNFTEICKIKDLWNK